MLNLKTIRGNTFARMPFELLQNNVPIDLTGAEIKMQLRKECNGVVYLELDQRNNGITITDAVNGKFQIDEQIINTLTKALSIEIEDRFQTADDFIDQNEEIVVLEVFKTNVLVEKWLG